MSAAIRNPHVATLTSEDIEEALDEIGISDERDPELEGLRPEDILPAEALPVPVPDGFLVDTEEKAAWVVRLFVECQDAAAHLEEQYQVMLNAIVRREAWLKARFGEELRGFVEGRLEGKREKTLHLLTGSCSLRTKPGGPRVRDAAKALAWAEKYLPEVVEVPAPQPRLLVNELKAYVEVVGEIPPGVDVVPDEEVFAVKPARARKGRG